MATELAKAYVQIIPSAEGIKGKLTSAMEGEADSAGKIGGAKFSSAFGGFISGAAKLTAGAVAGATAGVAALTKQAVDGYAQYEQLIGGVETLYGNSYATVEEYAQGLGLSAEFAADTWEAYQGRQQKVLDNAANAYKTSGLSANQYMETVNGFAASLTASLGEYGWQAANYAETTVMDMADNANKMGTSMESIQNAYAGFAKQNFTMLDNLKLGYGGTKSEMERLLAEAEKLGGLDMGSLSAEKFSDVVYAIHLVQEEMGITGTTAKEALSTIEGSSNMVKAAWQNLVTGLADDNADFSKLIDNLVNSLVGENGEGLINNLMPRIRKAIEGVGQLIVGLAPIIGQQLPAMIDSMLPSLTSAVSSLLSSLASALPGLMNSLLVVLPDLAKSVVDILLQNLPMLVEVAQQAILTLAQGLAEALPKLIPQLVDVVLMITETLIDNVDLIIDAAIALIVGLAEGLISATPKLIEKAPEIVIKLVEAIIRNAPKILQAGIELIIMLIDGIISAWGKVFEVGKQIVDKVRDGFDDKVQDAKNWGRDMIQNFIDGILEKWNHLKQTVSNVAQTVKDFLGFSEPEKGPLSNFHTYAPDMMKLFAEGIKDNENVIENQLNRSLQNIMVPVDMNVSSAQTSASDYQSTNNAENIAMAVKTALSTLGIYMDSRAVGALVADPVNANLGKLALRRV